MTPLSFKVPLLLKAEASSTLPCAGSPGPRKPDAVSIQIAVAPTERENVRMAFAIDF